MTNNKNKKNLSYLTDIMSTLRGPDGCPWDKEQTLKTLAPHTLEEAYEVLHALDTINLEKDTGDYENLKEELGDLLFQIVFACQMASEADKFDIGDVIETVGTKMVRRHPHVFGSDDKKLDTAKEVLSQWHDIKEEESKSKGGQPSGVKQIQGYLSGIPNSMPALIRANKVSEKAAKVGYDWEKIEQIFDKVDEELLEFKEALVENDKDHVEEEMGDMLFALVNLSRFVEVDAEEALRKTIEKFIRRFHYIEDNLTKNKSSLKDATLDEMEELWDSAKREERNS